MIDSYGLFRSVSKGAQHPFEQKVRNGEIEVEVYPMGTLRTESKLLVSLDL